MTTQSKLTEVKPRGPSTPESGELDRNKWLIPVIFTQSDKEHYPPLKACSMGC